MATAANTNNTKLATTPKAGREELLSDNISKNNTAKQTYTTTRYGNDHGSINFGHVHKQGECIADILLQASDQRHSIALDKDGPRKGATQITAPGRITIESGEDLSEAEETLMIHSWNGNISIIASNGKLRLQGNDVEIIAVGEGGSKGNVRIKATETIELDGKKVIANAKNQVKMVSSGKVELAANSCLNMYGSMIKAATDAVNSKDSKVGGRNFQVKQIEL
jgi:hypothetical protein